MVTPLQDPLGDLSTPDILISGGSTRRLIAPLVAPLAPPEMLNTSFSEHFHPSSIVVPLDDNRPPPDPLPGEPTVPILKGNDRRVIMKRYLEDQNRARELEEEQLRVYHEPLPVPEPPEPEEFVDVEELDESEEDFDEGPPVLTPITPTAFDFDSDEYLPQIQAVGYFVDRGVQCPSVPPAPFHPLPRLRIPPKISMLSPLKKKPKLPSPKKKIYNRKHQPYAVWEDRKRRNKEEEMHDRLARLQLREAKAQTSTDSDHKNTERKRIIDDVLQLIQSKVDGEDFEPEMMKTPKGKGGRPLKRSRGPKAQENNAYRAWERDQRVAMAQKRKKQFQELFQKVKNFRTVDDARIEIDGIVYELSGFRQVAQNMVDAILKRSIEEYKKVKAHFIRRSHKAKVFQ